MKISFPDAAVVPGPQFVPGIGLLFNSIRFMRNAEVVMQKLFRNYGEVVGLTRGSNRFVFIFSPKYNHQVLSNTELFRNGDFKSSPIRFPENSAAARLTNGLVVMNGEKHAQQRRMMMPAFHKKRVEAYRDAMVEQVEKQLETWQTGQQRDMLVEMRKLTLAIVVKTLFGLDPYQEGKAVRRIFEQAAEVSFSIPMVLFQFDLPSLPYRKMLRATEKAEQEIQGLIEQKRASGLDQGDVLSMLLQAHDEHGTRLTNAELAAQIMTLFTAGHETTATALTWTLFLLSQHPAVLYELEDELNGTLNSVVPTIEQLEQLKLLDRVIKESMRILPPFLWNLRVATAPFELGPYALPAGTNLVYSPAMTHRLPDLYPQPAKFLPNRWLTIDPLPYEYLPFAAGPRRCLGATFAMLEIKIVLAILLQRYRLSVSPGTRVDRAARLMLSYPKHGMPMLLNPPGQKLITGGVQGNIREIVDLPE